MTPLHSSGTPTIVHFGFIIEDVIEVDEDNLSIELEFIMNMRWTDPRIMLTAFVSKTKLSYMTREERVIDTDTRHVIKILKNYEIFFRAHF